MPKNPFGDLPCWFVLNYVGYNLNQNSAESIVDHFNDLHDKSLKIFAPTYVVREERDGKIRMRTAKLAFHYVFVNGTFDEIKALCSQDNGFSFLINHSSENRYAVVSDQEMVHFKNIARVYENCLPYFQLTDIDLEEGDLVEVVNGDFPGLIGTFIPKAKSKSGNVVLKVFNNVCTIAYDIKISDIRILEYSRKSTRANDHIDAFTAPLLKSLRYFYNEEQLPKSLVAKLSVFCMRMSMVHISNHKLDAKLNALLYVANFILGNMTEADEHKARFEKQKPHISNVWTRAMIDLSISIITRDETLRETAHNEILGIEPASKSQQMIADELSYYANIKSACH